MRVVGYVRLSRDEDKESYSSILSQKSIIEEYVLQHKWTISKYYEDDNCSGYSFDRPAFNELMKDIENDKVDVIIAKDLSRIGRHNAYTLLFLDKIKSLNKRLLLPKEGSGYDTTEDESDLLGITTWYNEMYVKDISRKIKSSIRAKQKEGRMIIKEAFGYQKSLADKHKLEVDIEAAAIVQKIFSMYLSGIGYRKIAEILNQEGYPTPSQYRLYKAKNTLTKNKTATQWSSVHVQRILKNDIYTGTLRLCKTEKKAIKGKSEKQPFEGQYVFENNHSAIVSKEKFAEAQQIAKARKMNNSKGAASLDNVFSGLMYCQDCGSYMIAYKRPGKPKNYICGSYHKYGSKSCQRHTIQEDVLKQAMKEFLMTLTSEYSKGISMIQPFKASGVNEGEQQLLKLLKKEQGQGRSQLKLLIMQKIAELKIDKESEYQNITEDCFVDLEKDLKQRLLYLGKRIDEIESKTTFEPKLNQSDSKEVFMQIINEQLWTKKNMEIFIDKILIDCLGNPTIYMKANFETLCKRNREVVIA